MILRKVIDTGGIGDVTWTGGDLINVCMENSELFSAWTLKVDTDHEEDHIPLEGTLLY